MPHGSNYIYLGDFLTNYKFLHIHILCFYEVWEECYEDHKCCWVIVEMLEEGYRVIQIVG